MAIISPTNRVLNQNPKAKKYAFSTRLWHWLNLLIISGSLFTVLINSTLLDRSQSSFVKSELVGAGASVTDQQAFAVTHALEDQVWDVHMYFGYALAALLLFRLVSTFFSRPTDRLVAKLRQAYQAYFIIRKERQTAKHELVVKSLYVIFYVTISLLAVTGLLLAFKSYTGISKGINHSIKEFHGFCMYLMLGFIALHVLGVLLAERRDGKGIVSDMINGG
ncbi:cytochrome b/b6 domain-containing protein [Pedobacter sandarakinus]|uniref:cytochrome b/b6 domain-containing protein n=1 Tax=Pedobacter sandarakinus TaxID=353156 RepID=UPI002246889A|nr:cytochrome b/b6 domain-containing protein [Pedobacter sandarakinus]MCX2574632.1 cytochrome b/b6 domain-containing protein [Pedobacter sandarakinus]